MINSTKEWSFMDETIKPSQGLVHILTEKKVEANELMRSSDTRLRHEGLGMMEVITTIKTWIKGQKKAERFLTQENTIVKDGFVYVRVNEIPFESVSF
jgi:hypothetical protein